MGKKLPVVSPNRNKLDWYELVPGKQPVLTHMQIAGFKMPSVAQLRLIDKGDDTFTGVKLNINGSIELIEGEQLHDRLAAAIQMPFRVSYREGKLSLTSEKVYDLIFAAVKCDKCRKFVRPCDCILDHETWGMTCLNCRTSVEVQPDF